MVFSLYMYYLCIVDQGENVSHQHQGEYDDIQAAIEHDIGNFYLHS